VAEGDTIVLALISHILTRQGYVVDVATTALEAEARLAAHTHDAVLLDAGLPGGGADWMRRCVTDPERRLVILTSGPFDADVPSRAILRKPVEFAQLVATVSNCVTPSN
jgi:DNA-binding response OmpR family regulator